MGIKRVVDTSFWTDDKVLEFTPEDRYFMLYLLTNPHTTQLGIYSISPKVMAFELGYSVDTVEHLLQRFEGKYNVIKRKDNEIAIRNYLQYAIMKGGKPVLDCLVKESKNIKHYELLQWIKEKNENKASINETVRVFLSENVRNDNDNDNDNEVSYHDTYHDTYIQIVGMLNETTGSNYKATSKKTQSLIRARLLDGFTVDDFQAVITKKAKEWQGTDMAQYLRPETLFGTKFEGYLNQPEVKNNRRSPLSRAEQERQEAINVVNELIAEYEEEERQNGQSKHDESNSTASIGF